MRRRRRKNSGLRWVFALVVVAALGYAGMLYWKGGLPMQRAAEEAKVAHAAAPVAAPVVAPAPVAAAPRPTQTNTFMAEAEARDAAARAAKEQTLKVQQGLRAQERERKEEAKAPTPNERCIDGQKMKRVDNGWVQAGTC